MEPSEKEKNKELNPEYTGFDTTETYTYKLAYHWNIPDKYIVVINNEFSAKPMYLNVYKLAEEKLEEGLSYIEVDRFLFRVTKKVWEGLVLSIELKKYVEEHKLKGKDKEVLEASFVGARDILKKLNEQRKSEGDIREGLTGRDLAKVYLKSVEQFKKAHKTHKKIVGEINRVHELYANAIKAKPFNVSSLITTVQKVQFIVEDYTSRDIKRLFDSLNPNPKVKNIIVCSPDGIYQSVYVPGLTGKNVTERDLVGTNETFKMDTITFTVDTGGTIHTLVYELEGKYIQTEIKTYFIEDILNILTEMFGRITINVMEVQCQMNLYPTKANRFDFREYYFLHRIIQYPEIYQCYLDESIVAYPEKNDYRFRYKPYWVPDSLKRGNKKLRKGMKNESFFYIDVPNQLDSNSYFTLNITSISLDSVYRLLTFLIPVMCHYYIEDIVKESTLVNLYNIPGIDEYAASKRPVGKVNKSQARRQLHDQWPEVFSEEYIKTKSVKPSEVVITTVDRLTKEYWENNRVVHKGISYKRKVLPFPKKGPFLFWFTFFAPPNQYPDYVLNTYDKDPKYKYIPACFSSKKRRKEKTGKSSTTVKSLKIRGPGQNGMVPRDTLDTILGFPVQREGVTIGPNSFLDAVATSLDIQITGKVLRRILALGCNDFEVEAKAIHLLHNLIPENIASILNVDSKHDVVEAILDFSSLDNKWNIEGLKHLLINNTSLHSTKVKEIIKNSNKDIKLGKYKVKVYNNRIGWEIYKQQLYDLSREEIKEYLDDKEKYFDPLLFIAGIEELFDIDIFMIVPTDKASVITHELVLPRHSHFYCRSNRLRKCIIIYKNPGKQSDKLPYPNCEIITPEGESAKLYSTKVTQILYNVLVDCNEITIVRGEGETYEHNYFKSQFYKILRRVEVVDQYVDSRGKCRAVTIIWNEYKFSIFCSPMAPLNCPIAKRLIVAPLDLVINLCTIEKEHNKGDESSSDADIIIGRSKVGVWLEDQESGEIIYVRVNEVDEDIEYIGSDPISDSQISEPLTKTSNAIFATKRDRMALIIREYMKWFFEIYIVDNISTEEYHLESFVDKYMGFTDMKVDEDDWYSVEGVGEVIPEVTDVEEAYNLMKLIIPVNLKSGRLTFHNRKYYECMIYTIQRHSKTFVSKLGKETKAQRYIPDYYKSLYDFHKKENAIIVSGLSNPIKTIVNVSNKYTVITELHSDLFTTKDPILFYDGNNYYIIQTTRVNAFRTAYTVCYAWWKYGMNIGYNAREMNDMVKAKVVIYETKLGLLSAINIIKKSHKHDALIVESEDNPTENMIVRDYIEQEDSSPDSDDFFEMILVDKIRYVALLRIS